ncbi:type II secretion system protein [Geopsychrobacter electrodiphilus]|uniref:type II secretion system protein n=1 Tax=Geopsychrobacter electrodiphilus TaxID=225196 RepID=UPI000374E392|nr:type II secretion system protein [Geopsychrobacter electrodiphilus]
MKQDSQPFSVHSLRYILRGERGVSLVLVLVLMAILGLSAGIAGSTWSSLTRRAREADLLWKGGQIRTALGSYYASTHAEGTPNIFPSKLEYLLKDPRFLETKRHLRQLYPDPMTGKDWVLIKDEGGRIKGVRSSLAEEPFKQGNFSEENKSFEGRGLYSEWEFVYIPELKTPTTTQPPVKSEGQSSPESNKQQGNPDPPQS